MRQEIEGFCHMLFSELLLRRSDGDGNSIISGFPVTDNELLDSLRKTEAEKASEELMKKWQNLKKGLLQPEDKINQRFPLLCWQYSMNSIWILAVMLAFESRRDVRIEKSIGLLQGDHSIKCLDDNMVIAIADYLGEDMESDSKSLIANRRLRQDLFEELPGEKLIFRTQPFYWLNEVDEISNSYLDGSTRYEPLSERTGIHRKDFERVLQYVSHHLEHPESSPDGRMIVELQGPTGCGKTYFSRLLAGNLGYGLFSVKIKDFAFLTEKDWKEIEKDIFFLCRVNSCIPYLNFNECRKESEEVELFAGKMAEEYSLLFAGTEKEERVFDKLGISTQKLSLEKLSLSDSLYLWEINTKNYPVSPEVDFKELTGKYHLSAGRISDAILQAKLESKTAGHKEIEVEDFNIAIKKQNKFDETNLAKCIDSPFDWDDLKVEDDVLLKLKLACAHIKYRYSIETLLGDKYPYGKGTGVLLYGPPGTGKTMAAQVIANAVQMELYRVDLSQISSKYIGETEKNLEKVFQEAERSNVILFFDEADSLFSKRTEVKDSNDKYANQETSYILQRIEFYEGMVIFATNFKQNFDNAFMRRITLAIKFEFPDEKTRFKIWNSILTPMKLNVNEDTIMGLAKQFEISGSSIKSVVRNAAFIAASEEEKLEIKHLITAMRLEYEKLGKMANYDSFGLFGHLI